MIHVAGQIGGVRRPANRARGASAGTLAGAFAQAAFCVALPVAAAAQQGAAGDDGGYLEEVVVTAQRREERLMDTPISVSAFTAAAVERMGVANVQELAEFAPNVTFDFTSPISGASNAAAVFIRGIGQSDFALTTEAGVGTYVDGVYMSRSLGGVLDVLDLERVEILRGPQGTLFGRNAIGGAINITSRKPGDRFGGYAQITGGSAGRRFIRAALDLPVSENLALRLAGSSKDFDGYVRLAGVLRNDQRSLDPGRRFPIIGDDRDLGNRNRDALRAILDWSAAAALDVTLSADYSRVRENNAASILQGITNSPTNGPIAFVYNTFEAPGASIPGFDDAFYTEENFVTGDLENTFATGPNGTEIDTWGTALTLDWAALEALSVKSITAWRDTDGFFNRDADGSPIDLTHTSNFAYRHRQFSQEIQLTGDLAGDRLRYVAGLYYFLEEGNDPLVVDFPESFGNLFIDRAEIDNESVAAYVQATYGLTERLALTGGLRYTRDDKEFFTDQFLVTGFASPFVFGAPAGTVVPLVPRDSAAAESFDDVSPRVALELDVSDALMVYGSFSQGFKSGGFNLRYVQPRPAVLPFEQEEVDAWEVGAKWESARVRLSLAGFYSDYTGIQLTIFENLGAPVTLNAGDAGISGVELELTAVPVENLELGLAVGYTDAEYEEIRQSPAIIVTPEQRITERTALPNTPEWQTALSAGYAFALRSGAGVYLRFDWKWTDDVFNDAQNSRFLFQDDFHLVNAAATWRSPSERWSVRAFVENLTDERYVVSGDSNFGIGFHEANYNRGREWGVEGRFEF